MYSSPCNGACSRFLEHSSLDLFPLPGVNSPPDRDGWEAENGDCRGRNKHYSLGVAVSILNANSCRAANRVAQLHGQVACNQRCIGHALWWQESCEVFSECASPDGTGDGGSDGSTDGAENRENGQDDGDVLVSSCRHGTDLLGDYESATSEGDEELTLR